MRNSEDSSKDEFGDSHGKSHGSALYWPHKTSSCPICGEKLSPNGQRILKCNCGLEADIDVVGSWNIRLKALKMWGVSVPPESLPMKRGGEIIRFESLACSKSGANEKAKRLYGADLIGKKCYEIIHKTSSPPSECHGMKPILEGRERVELYEPTAGKWISIMLDKESREFLHILFELPELLRLRKKIAESEKLYQTLIEKSVPIYTVQGVYVNTKLAELLGYPKESLIGCSPFDFIHPDDYAKTRLARSLIEMPCKTSTKLIW